MFRKSPEKPSRKDMDSTSEGLFLKNDPLDLLLLWPAILQRTKHQSSGTRSLKDHVPFPEGCTVHRDQESPHQSQKYLKGQNQCKPHLRLLGITAWSS
ncbi:UNVERIFIED_CONTAM: hypothetical protein FKN15_059771 [Acipenser sinensis]